jgi:hypothetical protein
MANFIKVYLLGNSQAVGGGTDLIRNESKKIPPTRNTKNTKNLGIGGCGPLAPAWPSEGGGIAYF